jgi:prevent-host-death family protein
MQVNIHEAKTHLSKLLLRVPGGDEIIIARAGVPVARLVPVEPQRHPLRLGINRGRFEVPEDFDAPLPPEILAAFYGEVPKEGRREKKPRRTSGQPQRRS